MNITFKNRAAALVTSVCMTLVTVYGIAGYAYPQAPAVRLASAAR
jgi:hypothetical protein